MTIFLFGLPFWDLKEVPTTSEEWVAWGSCPAEKLAREYGVEAINGTLEEYRDSVFRPFEIIYAIGHGSPEVFTTKYGKIFIRTPDVSMHIMGGRIVHLLSCLCGARLLPDLVRFGARAAIGYEKEFVIGDFREGEYAPRPCEEPSSDADCYTPSDCDLEVQRQLLRGVSVENATKASQSKFEREIERYETGDRSNWYIAPHMSRDLHHDLGAQVMYLSEAVAPPPSLWEKYVPGLAVGTLGLGMVMLAKPELEERGLI